MSFFKRSGPVEHIVIFLGNPGREYEETRHNAGFMTADVFAGTHNIKINRLKFSSLTALATIGGKRVFLMKPQTYMNLTGGALWQAMSFYKVPPERVIAVADDVALPVGRLRIRRSGSAGGHNGLRDIIAKCGGEGFMRVKIGVGAVPEGYDMADWVLSKFRGEDEKIIKDAVKHAAAAVESILLNGVDAAMGEYN